MAIESRSKATAHQGDKFSEYFMRTRTVDHARIDYFDPAANSAATSVRIRRRALQNSSSSVHDPTGALRRTLARNREGAGRPEARCQLCRIDAPHGTTRSLLDDPATTACARTFDTSRRNSRERQKRHGEIAQLVPKEARVLDLGWATASSSPTCANHRPAAARASRSTTRDVLGCTQRA